MEIIIYTFEIQQTGLLVSLSLQMRYYLFSVVCEILQYYVTTDIMLRCHRYLQGIID